MLILFLCQFYKIRQSFSTATYHSTRLSIQKGSPIIWHNIAAVCLTDPSFSVENSTIEYKVESDETVASESAKPVEAVAAEDAKPVETETPKKADAPNDEDDSLRLYLEPDTLEEDWIPTSQKSPVETTINEKTRCRIFISSTLAK